MPRSLAPSRERGFTLIEVMVALILLVLGVLGSAAMTLTALRDAKQSALRSQASAMTYELADLMRANVIPGSPTLDQESVFTGTQPAIGAVTAGCYVGGCSPAQMATSDYAQWLAKLRYSGSNVAAGTAVAGLPNASARVCRDAVNLASMTTCDNNPTSPLVIKLKWDEKFNNGSFAADLSGQSDAPSLVVVVQPY